MGWKYPGLIDQSVGHIDLAVREMLLVFKLWDHYISRTPRGLGFGVNRVFLLGLEVSGII